VRERWPSSTWWASHISVTIASCFLSLHCLTSSSWYVVFYFLVLQSHLFPGHLVLFFCFRFSVVSQWKEKSSVNRLCYLAVVCVAHFPVVSQYSKIWCLVIFIFVSGSEVCRRLASWWEDKITRNRHCFCLSKCMGYPLQEDYQPRKEIWLWLGICRSHSNTELMIQTDAHTVPYKYTSLQFLLAAVMSRQAPRLAKPHIHCVTESHSRG